MAALAPGTTRAAAGDFVRPLVLRMDNFLQREESDGVTLDPRRLGNPPEQIRLSVVPQLLGYCDLQPLWWREDQIQDVVQRADFLIRGLDAFLAGDAADGMLGYALLRAFASTGDARYRDAALPIVEACLGLDFARLRLNRGLMAALLLAQHHRQSGDPAALAKAREIVLLAVREQHADGSFPHVCPGSRDVHYTAWMAMELHRLHRLLDDPVIPPALARAHAFLQGRVGLDGVTVYEEPAGAEQPLFYYYSQPTCPGDYDTRGWTNELGYLALLFDQAADPRFDPVVGRIADLMDRGAVPDKWGYLPPPDDPYYAWAGSPRSVIRTSLVFWALAAVHADQVARTPSDPEPDSTGLASRGAEPAGARVGSRGVAAVLGPPAPNPARAEAWITLRLPEAAAVRVVVLDPAGRSVGTLLEGPVATGERRLRWDGRDAAGRRAPPGVYFVRLEVAGRPSATRRLALLP
jgi:hypothetical protein